jgi:acyl-coenzyme A synthetase/AMP-(fatty) acid ligase
MHQNLLSIETAIDFRKKAAPDYIGNWCITTSGKVIDYRQYRQDVKFLATQLPDNARFAFNLCSDRYTFMVALQTIALKGQTNLLPPNQAAGSQRALYEQFKKSYIVCDGNLSSDLPIPTFQLKLPGSYSKLPISSPDVEVDANHLAVMLFTSGTSGKPTAIPKRWGELQAGVELTANRFGLNDGEERHLVTTVPPQHMFGLELSIMLPLTCSVGFISNRPFFPEDIRQTLCSTPGRNILVTTPIHLKTCLRSKLNWRDCGCEAIISATAPLSLELAACAEERFGAQVREIYGSTETGAIASRRTVEGDGWRFYPGITVQPQVDGYFISGGHLTTPYRINDNLQIQREGRFKLLGRQSDMIKLAGKRASLSELNEKLNRIDGIIDGVFIDTAEPGEETKRLTAVVVAPGLTRKTLLDALLEWIDPVFLPRPLIFVDSLPRNETGKLPQQALQALLNP